MNGPKLVTVVGAAVTTFLVFGAVTIEAVSALVGGDIGPGIIGVFVGVVFGLTAALLAQWRWDTLRSRDRATLLAYAAFGLTLVFLAFLSYVNVPGVDTYLSIWRNLVIAGVVALVTAVAAGRTAIVAD